ncbi:MAG: Zn-ribbon domain-containing OB-fold protein [Burkholderiales bacterium]|nr:Zn-ribbon domain-containing OB-fold protein [Burkholderiales bacterium]
MRKIPAPRVLPESLAFWQAADAGRLVLKKCQACGRVHHYPRAICPFCLSDDTAWAEAAGTGTVYSFSTMGKGEEAYTLAYVTLAEGVTLMTNLVDCDPARVAIGQAVRVVFRPSEGGHAVPMFTPVEGAA